MVTKFATVDEYISSFPDDVQLVLEQVRRTIRSAVPEAGEKISYQLPTVTLDGSSLVHFAAWKHHISLYPIPPVDEALAKEIAPYRSGEGTLKFPLREPVPYHLIERLAAAFVAQRRLRD
jgi:uncharacterized protein YdhG (YjbR/CyaY superfamily)